MSVAENKFHAYLIDEWARVVITQLLLDHDFADVTTDLCLTGDLDSHRVRTEIGKQAGQLAADLTQAALNVLPEQKTRAWLGGPNDTTTMVFVALSAAAATFTEQILNVWPSATSGAKLPELRALLQAAITWMITSSGYDHTENRVRMILITAMGSFHTAMAEKIAAHPWTDTNAQVNA